MIVVGFAAGIAVCAGMSTNVGVTDALPHEMRAEGDVCIAFRAYRSRAEGPAGTLAVGDADIAANARLNSRNIHDWREHPLIRRNIRGWPEHPLMTRNTR